MTFQVVGYAPRWHAMVGESVPIHVSTAEPSYWTHLRRIGAFIGSPDDWSSHSREVPGTRTRCAGIDVPLTHGSYLHASSPTVELNDVTVALSIRQETFPSTDSTLLEVHGRDGTFAVRLSDLNTVGIQATSADATTFHDSGLSLPIGTWCEVSVEQTECVTRLLLKRAAGDDHEACFTVPSTSIGPLTAIVAAGRSGEDGISGDLDAKLDGLRMSAGDRLVTRWDFSSWPYSADVPDSAHIFASSALVNGPTRAVTGARWTGRETDVREDPQSYSAVAFHRDDLEDTDWPVGLSVTIPTDTEPGVYCVMLSISPEPDFTDPSAYYPVTIFVTAAPSDTADIVLVLPTFSYRAYANNAYYEEAPAETYVRKGPTASAPVYEYVVSTGLKSLYGQHDDGTGVHIASLRRPQATVRPDWVSQLLGQPHQLSADLQIVQWLNELGVSWTLLTDESLHELGATALAPFRTVLTGSHPEYCSTETLNAYDDHLRAGGNLMYLGGNGFILKVEVPCAQPWMQELRRGDNGGDIWASRPGEMHHQFSGRPGGLWRRLGRPPNLLTGLGFSAMGFSGSGHYVTPPNQDLSSLPPRLRASFSGLNGRPFGLAGLELDSYDPLLGSPDGAVVLGELAELPTDYRPVSEYLEVGADPARSISNSIHAHVVWWRSPEGGQVFAVGSIAWTEGLNTAHHDHRVREITTAALRDMTES